MSSIEAAALRKGPAISSAEALRIANADAQTAYRDLGSYRISVSLEDDVWKIDYELKNPCLQGGGPHYLIDATTGEIRHKQYEQ